MDCPNSSASPIMSGEALQRIPDNDRECVALGRIALHGLTGFHFRLGLDRFHVFWEGHVLGDLPV